MYESILCLEFPSIFLALENMIVKECSIWYFRFARQVISSIQYSSFLFSYLYIVLTLVFPLCQAGGGRGGESLLKAEDKDDENRHKNGFD